MTRRDYQALAAAIRDEYDAWKVEGDSGLAGRMAIETVASNIVEVLAADNPRFDRMRFLEAALGEEFEE